MKAAPVPRQSRTHWDTTCRLDSNRQHTPLLWLRRRLLKLSSLCWQA